MAAAIGVLARIELPGAGRCAAGTRRVLAVGEMAELGVATLQLHREAGERARKLGIDVVIGVGDCAPRAPLSAFLEGARGSGVLALHADSIEEAAALLLDGPQRLARGDALLVKASRAVGLDRLAAQVVEALEARGRAPELVHGAGVAS
jgi:UDP-N-acetylmuramoyl-tripeptide--D-alanyl-D-alanine ligase